MESFRARARLMLAAALVLGTVGLGTAAAYAADDPDDSGGGLPITVIVRPSVPTPAPGSPKPTPKPTSTSKPTNSNSSTSAPTTPATDDGEDLPTLGEDAFSVGGVLYVSGMHTRYVPDLDPARGEIRASFTVRNVSTTTIDSYSGFGLTNFLGQKLSSVEGITVLRLEPGETRVVKATLENAGQWAVETATYTLTPTSLVDGQRVPSVTRDSVVFFLPWLVLVIAVLGAAGYAIARILLASRRQLVEEPA